MRVTILLMIGLLTACGTGHKEQPALRSLQLQKEPQWIEVEKGRWEYCDRNICAKTQQEYHYLYKVMGYKVQGL